jgi:NADH:ubiquinone reductase (H+-translocating)
VRRRPDIEDDKTMTEFAPARARHYPIVIAGGGFAGAYCAKYLAKHFGKEASNQAALIADQNVLTFQPMLAEVVGASLSPLDAVNPLRLFCRGTNVLQGRITEIDLDSKCVTLEAGRFTPKSSITFDHLVLALGSIVDVSHVSGMSEHGYVLKDAWDAVLLRVALIERLEEANLSDDEDTKQRLLTFVVVGGGFSGVETAGQILDLVTDIHPLYLNLKKTKPRVVLIHSRDHILPEIGQKLGDYAQRKLTKRGMEIRLNTRVTSVTARKVILSNNDIIGTHLVVSTVGNAPHPLIVKLCEKYGLENLRGRIVTEATMRVEHRGYVWAIGDCAAVPLDGVLSCPPTAQFALRQGIQLAFNLKQSLLNGSLKTFQFKAQGQLAAIGHRIAVADVMGFQFSGFFAWLIWRTIYASKIPGIQRKIRVVIDWTLDLFFSREISVIQAESKNLIQDVHFEKGDLLLQENDPYESFYIIKRGSLDCFRGTALIKKLGDGEALGGKQFAENDRWTVRAFATEPSTVIAVRRQVWDTLLTAKAIAEKFRDPAPTVAASIGTG